VFTVIKDSLSKIKNIDSIYLSISSMGEAFVPIDINGNILGNSMLYIDSRGQYEIDKLNEKITSKKIMELTGLPSHKMYSLPKILWLKNNNYELFKKTWKFLLYEDYIIYLLTGETFTDYSLASRTMAFNIKDKKWDQTILNYADIDSSLFAAPLQSGTIVGKVTKNIQISLGLPKDTYILTGGHDQACAALGGGALSQGMSVDGMGTAECITSVFDKPIINETMLKYNYNCEPHCIADKYITLAYCSSSGSLVKWFRDNFGYKEQIACTNSNMSEYQLLDSKVPKKPTGIILLPHFSGSGTPYLDSKALGGIFGLSLNTNKYDIYKSILEGITFEMKYNLQCLNEIGISSNNMKALGGGAKSDVWLQIKADIFNMPIERPKIEEAGTLGAIMLCYKAYNPKLSYFDISKNLVSTNKIYYPRKEQVKQYEVIYNKYKNAYEALNSIMQQKETL